MKYAKRGNRTKIYDQSEQPAKRSCPIKRDPTLLPAVPESEKTTVLVTRLGYMAHFRYTVMSSNIASIALEEKVGAITQKPESKVEELLVKTYYISKISMGIH